MDYYSPLHSESFEQPLIWFGPSRQSCWQPRFDPPTPGCDPGQRAYYQKLVRCRREDTKGPRPRWRSPPDWHHPWSKTRFPSSFLKALRLTAVDFSWCYATSLEAFYYHTTTAQLDLKNKCETRHTLVILIWIVLCVYVRNHSSVKSMCCKSTLMNYVWISHSLPVSILRRVREVDFLPNFRANL